MSNTELERMVAETRQRFLEGIEVDVPEVRRNVVTSWQRSASCGVDVDRLSPPCNPDIDVDGKLMHAARPVLDRLESLLTGVKMTVILTDDHGLVLTRRAGQRGLNDHLDEIMLAPGFSYAEEHVGTNGIGTAIENRRPFRVFGSEHFSERLQTMSCAGAPVRDPVTGQMTGLLDVSCRSADATPLMAALVQEAASDIEQRLLADRSPRVRTTLA